MRHNTFEHRNLAIADGNEIQVPSDWFGDVLRTVADVRSSAAAAAVARQDGLIS